MERVRFANQLRGVAALMVACSPLVGVVWLMPDVVSLVTATPTQTDTVPGIVGLVVYPWVNLGLLEVGVFFLISGLVIPFSLEKIVEPASLLPGCRGYTQPM